MFLSFQIWKKEISNMRILRIFYSTFILFCGWLNCHSQISESEIKLNGFVDTYHAIRSKKPNDMMSSRSRLRTELRIKSKNSFLYASVNAIDNSIMKDNSGIELREAYFQYTNNGWDAKIGRQIVTWGVADAVRVTDLISPMDYTEFLARDYDDIRIPINGFDIKYVQPKYKAQLIFVPVPDFFIMPMDTENPWSMFYNCDDAFVINDLRPETKITNCEYGGSFTFYMKGFDFTLCGLHTWNKIPVNLIYGMQPYKEIEVEQHYQRMSMLGFNFSGSIGQFVVRGEMARYFDKLHGIKNKYNAIQKFDVNNALIGLDWYPGYDWTIAGQFMISSIEDYHQFIVTDEITQMGTFNVKKKLLRSTLDLSSFAYIDLVKGSLFNRFTADYAVNDQIHVICGYDLFSGDKGKFGVFKDNSQYWIKAKYSF